MLNSSPSVLRRLNNKGSLLGINIPRLQQKLALDSIIDIRRKWYIQPAFSVEFVSYYMGKLSNDFSGTLNKLKNHFLALPNSRSC